VRVINLKKYSVEVECVKNCPTGHHPINVLATLEDGPDEIMKVTDYFKEGEVPEKLNKLKGYISVCSMTGRNVRVKDVSQLILNPDTTSNTGKMEEI
jgi:hypothetical protein